MAKVYLVATDLVWDDDYEEWGNCPTIGIFDSEDAAKKALEALMEKFKSDGVEVEPDSDHPGVFHLNNNRWYADYYVMEEEMNPSVEEMYRTDPLFGRS